MLRLIGFRPVRDRPAQMAKVARYLESERAAAIYASPRFRTVDSARILASGLERPVEIVPDLREINFGDFEGLSYDDIAATYPDLYRQWMESPTTVHFPNGECEAEVRERVLRAFETICRAREGQTAVIVSHSGVIRIIVAWALGMPPECIFRLSQAHAAVNLLSLHDGFPCLDLLNYRLP
jgi:broad specificity phosphatase PhoE